MPGRRLAVVGVLALAAIVVAALAAALVGRPPEDTAVVPAADVSGPEVPGDRAPDAPTVTTPASSPRDGAGATPLADPRVACTHGEEVAVGPCVSWSVQLDRFPTTGAAAAGRTVAVGARPDVVGLDARTGEARWRSEVGRVAGVVAARDGTGFVAWTDVGELVVLEPVGGRVVWRAPARVDVLDATLLQGWVVAATDTGIHGWLLDAGEKEWHVDVAGQPSRLAVGDGVVAVGDGNGEVRYIDVDTGVVRWSAATGTWYVTLTPDGALILTAGFGSPLLALDTRAGEIVWESPQMVGWITAQVLPGTGRAVAQVDDSDTLVLVDLATGALVREEPGLGDLVGSAVDAWALVRSADRILAYDGQRADGSVGWVVHLDGEPVGAPTVIHPGPPAAPAILVTVTTDGRVVATSVPARVP